MKVIILKSIAKNGAETMKEDLNLYSIVFIFCVTYKKIAYIKGCAVCN